MYCMEVVEFVSLGVIVNNELNSAVYTRLEASVLSRISLWIHRTQIILDNACRRL
jgi:hypothetical protein